MSDPEKRRQLIEALSEEHCGQCNDNSCDIQAAFDHECYLWAAHVLIGATECPKTEKAYAAINPTREQLDEECRVLIADVPHKTCESCNAVCWNVETDSICDNCGAYFVRLDEEEPEEEEEHTVKNWARVAGTQNPDEPFSSGGLSLRRKATNAQTFLEAYARISGLDPATDRAAMISDFLADTMHLCDMLGEDFDKLLRRADQHYNAEVDGE